MGSDDESWRTDKVKLLVSEFTSLSDEEKISFLEVCIKHCKIQMLHEETGRILARDFVNILPAELIERIFSYLDALTLCKASCVNRNWRTASNNDNLWFCICTRKQWVSFSQNKTLQQKPDVLLRPSSATKINVVRSFKTYDFCQYNSELLPLEKVCKWKDLFVRISHLQRNWADGLYTVKPVLRGHAQPVTCMDCDGTKIVSGSSDCTVKFWDVLTCECLATLTQFGSSVKCLQMKGTLLVTGCADCFIRIFDVNDFRMVRELLGHEGSVDHICVNDTTIASASADRMIKLWSVHDGTQLFELTGHTDDIELLKLTNNTLVSAAWDESVRVWDVESGSQIHSLRGHTEVVMCCQMDDVKLMTGGADGHIIIWDIKQGYLKQTLYGHAEVYCLEFNQEIIASGYADSTVRVWSIHGDLRHVLDGHIGIVRCIKLQGKRLISGGDCKRVIVWDCEKGELLNVVHRHPTSLHLMWVDETRIITASPETPGTVTVLSYWS